MACKLYNPPHPGETLREDILPALGLSVTDAAEQLGVTRAALSRVLNGRADLWLGLQTDYDLWHARKTGVTKVKPAKSLATA
ncbi:MAG: HigA family addiction module antidote protein [Proteobacteria bacterium]|nr:HigA family addiction module antidote protein [Pseudomonadota bacterium]